MEGNYFIKANRVFTNFRKYGYIYTLLVALGGLWFPKLGVTVLVIIGLMTAVAVFKGRYWCGNFCPHGSFFDSVMLKFSRNARIPRILKTRWLAVPFFLAFTYKLVSRFIMVSSLFGTMKFWDKLGFIFVASYLMVLLAGGTLSLLFSPRSWCNFCPMGSLQKLAYRAGKLLGINKRTDDKVSISHSSMCHKCGKCARVCPMQLQPYTRFTETNQFEHKNCIRCSTCVVNCPASILSLNNEKKALETSENIDLEGYKKRQRISAVIENISEIDKHTREYTFRLIDPEKVKYNPGQFILVKIQDEPEMFRAYSVSGFSEDGSELRITVRKVLGGYGTEIIFDTFHPGSEVVLEGPLGRELVINPDSDKLLFIAGGIGVTPFIPMVQDSITTSERSRKVDLVYGVNSQNEFLYDQHFSVIDSETPDFNYRKVVAFDKTWSGQKGFVTDVIRKMELDGYKAYLCGPKPMIDATLPVLKEKGLKEDDIYFESA